MKTLKVGVVGLGFIGPAHIEAIRRNPGVEVRAISHHTKEKAEQKASLLHIPRAYTDFYEMIAEEELDCVHICTPNHLHYPMAKAALEKGIHVVCEKPLAANLAEAKELVQLAEATALVNAVHFNIRYYPLVRQMKVMREKGELGEVFSIMGTYLQDWLFYQTDYNWRLEPEQSGESRAIADIGSHLIDLLEYITGLSVVKVMADFNTVHKTRKKPLKPIETYSGKTLDPGDYADVPIHTEDYASVLLHFDNGNKGNIMVSQVSAGRKNRLSLEISGAKKTFNWCSEKPNELWIGHRDGNNEVQLRDPALFHPEAAVLVAFPGGHNEGFPDTSKQLFSEVYADIRNGKSADPPYPTFADGYRELLLCERIVESHKGEKWVSIT